MNACNLLSSVRLITTTNYFDVSQVVKSFVYVSDDKHHDTWFVQHVLPNLIAQLPRGYKYKRIWVSTDGAPSHFKSRCVNKHLISFSQFNFNNLITMIIILVIVMFALGFLQ